MSNLTDALDRIMSWLERYQPDYAESFLPGLSRTEIDSALHEFGILIPEEVYELYQWRNGRGTDPSRDICCFCPSIYVFLSLHDAVEGARGLNSLKNRYSDNFLLPFLGYIDPELCTLEISDNLHQETPVLILFEGTEANLLAPNITSLFSFFAEAYEDGAYYLDVDEDGDEFVVEDEQKVEEIMRKYGLLVSALTA